MQVDRIHPAALTSEELEAAVVIDVLRATTTAMVLLARGVAAVRIVGTPSELPGLPSPAVAGAYLVFSELEASQRSGLECTDNSPSLAGSLELEGRVPVLVTTNGTRAVAAAMARARSVFVASFVNLSATAAHLRAREERVTLLPAGNFSGRQPRTEDERCADALEALLGERTPDLPALLADCWADERLRRRLARRPGLLGDVEVSLAVDRHAAVAQVVADDDGLALVRVG